MVHFHRIRFAVIILFSIFSLPSLFSQEPPIVWGEVPKEDLEMKSFPQDTNASALILCDYGESYFNDELDIIFNKILRVKILTVKGYEWGTHSIGIYTKNESIRDIQGITYSLGDHGEIVTKELDEDEIFTEEAGDSRTRYKFTLPGLKPGCVIEIRYTIRSTSLWLIQDWVFQHNEPVRWSEYRIRYPNNIAYAAVHRGYEPFAIYEKQDLNQMFSGLRNLLGADNVKCTQYRWAVKDLPALRDEPFITTIGDYINKVDIQLAGHAFVGQPVKHIMNDWNSLVNELADNEYFLQKIDDTRSIRKQAEEITTGLSSSEEKMKAIYDWTARSIVWTGSNRVFADLDVDDVLESKKGSNAEITFLLLSLLKSVGINGDPVIVSTRDHGKIQDLFPILAQFNYVLARVSIGSERYYIDATNPLRPLELLPVKVLNVRGLVIKKDVVEWTTLTSAKCYSTTSLAILNLSEDGSCSGTFEDSYRDYGGSITRQNLKDKKDIEVAKDIFETEKIGISIDSVQVTGRDSINLPLKLKAWISSSSYAQQNGDLVYINPHILHRFTENPLKSPKRKFPIDYSYGSELTTVTNIMIPGNFEVKEPLIDRTLIIGTNYIRYTQKVQIENNNIQIINKFEIRNTQMGPEFYEKLKDLYAEIVAIQSQQLVLERKKAPITPVKSIPSIIKPSKKKGKK